MARLNRFDTREALDKALAAAIADRLREGVEQRGSASLVVSGGSTPKGLFAQLSQLASQSQLDDHAIDWPAVSVLLADERWVNIDDPDRNEGMVREHLLTGKASRATFISLIPEYGQEADNLARVRSTLADIPDFDVVVLGMGEDGHTASLFPCSAELEEGLTTRQDVLMTAPTTAPHRRVSLSLQRLRRARFGLVHIVGERKLQVLEEAERSGDDRQFPIAAFLGKDGFDVWYAP